MSAENTNLNNVLPFRMADTDVARRAVEAARATLHPGWHDFVANAQDFVVDTYNQPGSGFGVSKNIVRVKHIPTGLFCECSSERGQHANREKALNRLIEMIKETKEMQLPVLPTKEEVLQLLNTATTNWLPKAMESIARYMRDHNFVLNYHTSKASEQDYWCITVEGDPSPGDITQLCKALENAGWQNSYVTRAVGVAEVTIYKD